MIKKIKIRKMNRKGQIGSTLTWFVGFLVIFFVIGLFLAATTLFSLKKKIISGSDEIEMERHLSNAKEQRILFSLLNSNINFSDKEIKIKDILKDTEIYSLEEIKKNDLKEKIENKVKEILLGEFGASDCYIFDSKYGVKEDLNFISKGGLSFSSYDNPDPLILDNGYILDAKERILKNSVSIILVRNVKTDSGDYEKIIINFYGGKCL